MRKSTSIKERNVFEQVKIKGVMFVCKVVSCKERVGKNIHPNIVALHQQVFG